MIIDDCFPYAVSGFRLAEYSYLLRYFSNSRAISSLAVLNWLDHDTTREDVEQSFSASDLDLAKRTFYSANGDFTSVEVDLHIRDADFIYTIFLNNAWDVIAVAEKHRIPFVFTLYPGGGFALGNKQSLEKLSVVLASPYFAGVIATQPETLRELKRHFPKLSKLGKLKYVFGGVLQDPELEQVLIRPDIAEHESSKARPVNICFVANKYEAKGRDKGFDIFVECVARIKKSKHAQSTRFHVVGPWNRDDLGAVADLVEIHGQIENRNLPAFLARMDIGIFPTRAGRLSAGSFDGFPVGAAVESAKSGVAVISTNPLKQKTPLRRGVSYLEIKPTTASASKALLSLLENPAALLRLKLQGQKDFQEIYSIENQMRPRVEFLKSRLACFTEAHPREVKQQ